MSATPAPHELLIVRDTAGTTWWVLLGDLVLAEGFNERDAWFRAHATLAGMATKAEALARRRVRA